MSFSVYEKRAPVHTSFPDDYEGQRGLGKCQAKFIRYLEIETGPLAFCLVGNYLLNCGRVNEKAEPCKQISEKYVAHECMSKPL
jgi:hypothetical protein